MAEKKRFIVLGLGTFGAALANRLCENGCHVTGVDANREAVEALKDKLYEAVVADVTDRNTLEHLAVKEASAVFMSLGGETDVTPTLLAAMHAKELDAREIVVKALNRDHAKILNALGVTRVVFPEEELAVNLADRMTWPNVLDFMPIDPEYSFVEITVPESLVGTTLFEADLRRRFNIWVIGIKDALSGKLDLFPDPQFRFGPDQLMVIVGRENAVNDFREFD